MTGKQFIIKLLESGVDLNQEMVFSHRRRPAGRPMGRIPESEWVMDNYYAIEAPAEWNHPDEHNDYTRIVLK